MKKVLLLLLLFSLVGCSTVPQDNREKEKPVVMATLFPQYDFVKEIVQDKMEVQLLLPPGADSHTYEPSTKDLMVIENADLFIYTGASMEMWADKMLQNIQNKDLKVVDASENINLLPSMENYENHDHDHEEHHHGEYDPHIWTSPSNAIVMVENILAGVIEVDPDNTVFYQENAERLIKQLQELDHEIHEVVDQASQKTIVFGSPYSMHYFMHDYGIEVISAYTSDTDNSEPSIDTIKRVVDYIKDENIPYIFYQENTSLTVVDTIMAETGIESLLFHSCHNVSQQQLQDGVTYLELMQQNLLHLKKALSNE